eukprot:3292565-Amphidinium_carterae.1
MDSFVQRQRKSLKDTRVRYDEKTFPIQLKCQHISERQCFRYKENLVLAIWSLTGMLSLANCALKQGRTHQKHEHNSKRKQTGVTSSHHHKCKTQNRSKARDNMLESHIWIKIEESLGFPGKVFEQRPPPACLLFGMTSNALKNANRHSPKWGTTQTKPILSCE